MSSWYLGFDDYPGGMALTGISASAKTSDVSSASRGTSITVGSDDYTVRENRPVDDGIFSGCC